MSGVVYCRCSWSWFPSVLVEYTPYSAKIPPGKRVVRRYSSVFPGALRDCWVGSERARKLRRQELGLRIGEHQLLHDPLPSHMWDAL